MVRQVDPAEAGTDPLIMTFLDALVATRAVSANTLAAYRRDLADTSQLLYAGKRSLSDCNADDLRQVVFYCIDVVCPRVRWHVV